MKPIDIFGLEVMKCFDCPFLEHQNVNAPKGWCSKTQTKVYPNLTPPSDSCPFIKKVSRDSFRKTIFLNTDLTSIYPVWRVGEREVRGEYHLPTHKPSLWEKDDKKEDRYIIREYPIHNEAMLNLILAPILWAYDINDRNK